MPSFISIEGKCYPAMEKAVNRETGEVYEGPDREAVRFIAQETGLSVEDVIKTKAYVGMSCIDDPQILEVARQRNMTIEEYMKINAPTPKQVQIQKEAQSKVVTHTQVKTKEDNVGGLGGFFDPEKKQDAMTQFNKKMGA